MDTWVAVLNFHLNRQQSPLLVSRLLVFFVQLLSCMWLLTTPWTVLIDSLEKDPDTGKDWRQEEKGTTKDGMVGWHHQLDEHEFEQALGVGDGQGGHGVTKSWTRLSNWTELDCSSPVSPVLHHLLEFAQIHVCWVGDAIYPSHPLPPSSPFAFNLS